MDKYNNNFFIFYKKIVSFFVFVGVINHSQGLVIKNIIIIFFMNFAVIY